jgi:glycerophosphoryl diester phosphodiesterase
VRHDLTVRPGNVVRPELLSNTRNETRRSDRALTQLRFPVDSPVSSLTLTELRRLDPEVLTLEEMLEIAGDTPVLVDIKTDDTALPLGRALARRRHVDGIAVCTESLAALATVRLLAPAVARWPSFPDIGSRAHEHIRRVVIDLVRAHRIDGARRGLGELGSALGELRRRPHHGFARIAGLPWRNRLPVELAWRCREIGAAGICVQHWLVTAELCAAARRLRLPMTAWTVNRPDVARRLAHCGVDMITTDDIDTVRQALHQRPSASRQEARTLGHG